MESKIMSDFPHLIWAPTSDEPKNNLDGCADNVLRTNYETIFQAFLRTIAIYVRTCGKDRVYDRLSFWSLHVRTHYALTNVTIYETPYL